MNRNEKIQRARAAAHDSYKGETLQAQAIAILASLASKNVLPKYVRDEYQQGLIDLRLADDPTPAAVEPIEGESDAQYDARVIKAQQKHGRKIAAWARKRVNRAMAALEKDHGIEVPRDARGGADNAKKAEPAEPETASEDVGQQADGKGTDERPTLDTSKSGQQAAADTLMAAIASRKDSEARTEALAAFETVAAFLKLDTGLN